MHTRKRQLKCSNAIQYALTRGRIQKTACEICGAEQVDAHHASYDHPLAVTWLCRKHHIQLHREFAEWSNMR